MVVRVLFAVVLCLVVVVHGNGDGLGSYGVSDVFGRVGCGVCYFRRPVR